MLPTWLTHVTHNVTAIFDCCHSALMSLDPAPRVKAYKGLSGRGDPAAYATIARHLRAAPDAGNAAGGDERLRKRLAHDRS